MSTGSEPWCAEFKFGFVLLGREIHLGSKKFQSNIGEEKNLSMPAIEQKEKCAEMYLFLCVCTYHVCAQI